MRRYYELYRRSGGRPHGGFYMTGTEMAFKLLIPMLFGFALSGVLRFLGSSIGLDLDWNGLVLLSLFLSIAIGFGTISYGETYWHDDDDPHS